MKWREFDQYATSSESDLSTGGKCGGIVQKTAHIGRKREATIQKYTHDVRHFLTYHGKQTVCKEDVIQYKAWLAEHYAVRSTNSMLIALNRFLRFQGAEDCCVKPLKVQRQTFCDKKKRTEPGRIFPPAGGSPAEWGHAAPPGDSDDLRDRNSVSELAYITVEAARLGRSIASNKGKNRIILIPKELCRNLLDYAKECGIQSGAYFLLPAGGGHLTAVIFGTP